MQPSNEKMKKVKDTINQINKSFGNGSVMMLGDKTAMNVDCVSTGILPLDIALGTGGLPKGRIVEIYGPESSGKTTFALHSVAEMQKLGGVAAFVDAEHALDPVYAEAIGVNLDDLVISQPDTGEQALSIAEALICSGAVNMLVIDSVAALVPKAEIEGDMGQSHVGLQARLMSQALRKLTGHINKYGCIVIFINQLREKVGVMFGNPETTTGGRALKFYASIRMDIRKIDTIKQGDKVIGNRTRVKIVKNKIAPPFTQCEFDVMYGEGVSKTGALLDIAADKGIIKKSGAWYGYNGKNFAQGREKAKEYLASNKKFYEEIDMLTRNVVLGLNEEVALDTDI